jgi:hypothetical protein
LSSVSRVHYHHHRGAAVDGPSFLDIVDQQLLWWDTLLDLLIVPLEDLDSMLFGAPQVALK